MKKLFLSLAAFAALVSCVEENALTPEKTGDNLVTIKAVAAETKTTLADDGTSIVWENGDAISLIFNYTGHKSAVICDTEIESPASNADFTGDISEIDLENAADQVNLIYPATAFNDSENKITFSIPAEQDGIVGSGENFSYAVMAKSDIAGEKPEAQFHNALSLFKITVPEGVKTLKLTSNTSISGTNTYEFDENGALKWKGTSNVGQTVFINDENGLDASSTYDVLVFPGEIKYLTLELTGTDGATYTKTMSKNGEVFITLEAGKYYNLKMANLFTWNIGTELTASPLGDELVISASTTAENKYDITITDEDGVSAADWISAEPLTKGFHKDEIVLYVEENLTSATRKAKVTISYGDDKSQIFTVTQNCVFMDFVYTEENPIQWQESFGIFQTEELSGDAIAQYNNNVFTIELNEENPGEGAYIVKNIFMNSQFTSFSGNEMNKGGEYYANYEDGKLTILKSNAKRSSYVFANDVVVLTYDSSLKKFTSGAIELGYTPGGPNNQNYKFIGNYEAVHYVAPDPGEGDESPYSYLFGEYAESFDDSKYYGNPSKGTLTIEASDNADYHLKMTFFGGTKAATITYANVSDDGTTLTTVKPTGYTNMGVFYESTLTLSDLSYDGPIWGTLIFDYPERVEYTAFKK